MLRFCLLLLSFALLQACNAPSPTTESDVEAPEAVQLSEKAAEWYTLVGMTHDTAMVLMAPLERTQMGIRKTLDYVTDHQRQIALQLLTDLKKAGDGMMDWMHEFKSIELHEEEYQTMTDAQIIDYLKEQNTAMEQIDQAMRSAINEGQSYIRQYSKAAPPKKETPQN